MRKFGFDCGCTFNVIDENRIEFSPKLEHINLECKKTWDLISTGNTKGIFQLESRLGQMMAKKLKPENIEQLSGLISVIRPGCLEAKRDGKSVTNHYVDRKNGLESIDYFHPSLEPILKNTFGEMCYQEQAMSIAKEIAGFNLQEADELRKAIGKKQADKMAKVKQQFINGSIQTAIVTKEEAEQIFSWIEKSQRYLFNASHGISYAMNAYLSAYTKAHFPQAFFSSYLRFAKDKIDPQQEIKELVKNANEMDILVMLPDLRLMNELFTIYNDKIYFGITDIKGVGQSVYVKLKELVTKIDITKSNWLVIMLQILHNINSTAAKAIIISGCLDYLNKQRTEMVFEYELCSELTKKEIEYCLPNIAPTTKLFDLLTFLINHPKVNIKRKSAIQTLLRTLQNPPYSLTDKVEWLSDSESSILGVAISCSKLDTYDIEMTNMNCREFKNSGITNNIVIAGEISGINIVKTKSGKNPGQEMAFVSIEDQTGLLDSVVFFPEQFGKYKHHLFENNILVFSGNKSKSKDGLVVEKCFVPTS
jgi:DNA polymerase-3 subunit alpha